jgi:hyaluronan synthase
MERLVFANMGNIFSGLINYWRTRRLTPWVVFFFLIYVVAVIKLISFREMGGNFLFDAYSLLVSFYILSRFALAYFYSPKDIELGTYEPTMTFAVPGKNEGDNIYETIMRIAQSDYPKEKFDVIAINDGSTDNTLDEMERAAKDAGSMGVRVDVVDWKINKGKREGMAECVRLSNKEIVFFIDSDSFVAPDAAREVAKYFALPNVGAVAGHAYVANEETNFLTKMQAVRYYVAFKAYKAAEALFGTVTCCSGCCSAYRREFVLPFLEDWTGQKFLGVQCTYGDDRSLTNYLLYYGRDTIFAPEVIAYTFVPDNFRQFMRQQLRWKKSWIRESLIASVFIWKRNPIMSISFYMGVILPLMAPIVVARALFWYPLTHSHLPIFYFFGLLLMATIYGLYYYIYTADKKWVYGVLFASFYTLVLIWQLPYAALTIRDSRWGTR